MCETRVRNYSVYAHISPNNKIYFGITGINPEVRWKNGRGYYGKTYFSNAIKKYGWDNFQHIILIDNLSKEVACECEKYLISKYNTNNHIYGYNMSIGGESGTVGYYKHHSEETKRKIGEAHKGLHHTDASKQKMREKLCGRKLSDETKRKMSEAHKRLKTNGMLGKHHSEETKLKMSKAQKGKTLSEEHIQHIKDAWIRKREAKNATI